MAWGKCSNCGKKPCTSSCAAQAYPAHGSSRLGAGSQPVKGALGRDKDGAYEALKANQDANGRPHAVRNLTGQDVRDGLLQEMIAAGAVDHSETRGSKVKVILRKGFEDSWTDKA